MSRRSAAAVSSEQVPSSRNKWIRQTHRWLSIAFTLAVIGNLVALGKQEPAVWVGLAALLPLALLLFTGLYLFALPYAARRRGGRPDERAGRPHDRPVT